MALSVFRQMEIYIIILMSLALPVNVDFSKQFSYYEFLGSFQCFIITNNAPVNITYSSHITFVDFCSN